MSRIEVSNPVPGGQRFVRIARAVQYVRSGRAVWDGERIRFVVAPEAFVERLRTAEADAEFRRNHGERICWNGSDPDPLATHRPGEVRS